MPCNFQVELTLAVNSNPMLKSIHQKYKTLTNQIILKMASSKYKYNSDEYIDEYLLASKSLINGFTMAEKFMLTAMELDNIQLQNILEEYQDISYILAAIMDKKYLL